MKTKSVVIVMASVLAITACSQKQPNSSSSSSSTSAVSEAKEVSSDVALTDYMDVSNDPTWTVKWFFANNSGYSDDDVMNYLEPNYYQETDAFKKHDMMTKDLSSLKQSFMKFKGVKYIKYTEINSKLNEMPDAPNLFQGYDFSTQSFKLADALCLGGQSNSFSTKGTVWWKANKDMCQLKVANEDLAKKMETARQIPGQAGSLVFSGTIYAKVMKADSNDIYLQATHAHYKVGLRTKGIMSPESTPLTEFDL